ncbi:ATP-grasp domain-containing protein [Microvirga sp. 2TAF3]|uniref:ATP-grasp domain-containing protein n=1 Tax=Microvirga sp. 2TAF3 TaxID=3233014 RepID=UPI003F9CB0CE
MTCVLVIAPSNDVHALSVARSIRLRYPAIRCWVVDGEDFPINYTLTISPSGWRIQSENGEICSDDVLSLWWRRPGAPRIDSAIVDANSRNFAHREATHSFDSIALSTSYAVINRPDAEFRANKKPIQLWEAQQAGLKVPDYCITNQSDAAKQFIRKHDGDVIFKSLTSPKNTFGETRRMFSEYDPLLPDLQLAPAIFQKRITREKEYRITIIGETVFAHEIVINNEAVRKLDDWRLDVSAEAKKTNISSVIVDSLRDLMHRLNLKYGAIDLIENSDGELFFLEVNSSGQFLFAEIDTMEPMSDAFADLLCNPQP